MRDVSARHAVGRTRSVWAGAARTVAVVATVVAVSAVSVAAYGTWRLADKAQDGAIDIGQAAPSLAALDGAFNVLLVGADNAPGQRSFGERRDATLNDELHEP